MDNGSTMKFDKAKIAMNIEDIILEVHKALEEKGYNPISQIVGYIMSGDPSYITSHNGARTLIQKIEPDEILEELVRFYVKR